MKILRETDTELLIEKDEPILLVQITIGALLLSIPISLIIGVLNMWTSFDTGIKGTYVFAIPLIALGIMTLNGTPCKTKWMTKEEFEKEYGVFNGLPT